MVWEDVKVEVRKADRDVREQQYDIRLAAAFPVAIVSLPSPHLGTNTTFWACLTHQLQAVQLPFLPGSSQHVMRLGGPVGPVASLEKILHGAANPGCCLDLGVSHVYRPDGMSSIGSNAKQVSA